jgi:Integrase zinc binding domain
VANDALRRELMATYHNHITAGHPGISETLFTIEQEYWWPDMKKFITQYVKGCPKCQETKSSTTKPKIPTYLITVCQGSEGPWRTMVLVGWKSSS